MKYKSINRAFRRGHIIPVESILGTILYRRVKSSTYHKNSWVKGIKHAPNARGGKFTQY